MDEFSACPVEAAPAVIALFAETDLRRHDAMLLGLVS
jgi:hypothetical protein